MKTKVLKLMALSAMMLVPIGAWADETVVSAEKIWNWTATADAVTSVTNSEGLYFRASASKNITYTGSAIGSSYSSTADGRTLAATKIINYAVVLAANSSLAPSSTTTVSSDATDADAQTLAIKTSVAGTIYVWYQGSLKTSNMADGTYYNAGDIWFKGSEDTDYSIVATRTLNNALTNGGYDNGGRFALLTYSAKEGGTFIIGCKNYSMTVYDVMFVPETAVFDTESYNNTAKTWSFGTGHWETALETETNNQIIDGLCFRGLSTTNSSYGLQDAASGFQSGTFIDGRSWEGTQYASVPAASNIGTVNFGSRRTAENDAAMRRGFAFNVTRPGTCYVQFKNAVTCNLFYSYDRAGVKMNYASATGNASTLTEVKLESSGNGTFWIGATGTVQIYAIHFVPDEAAVKIGSQGMSSFSSPNALDFSNATVVGEGDALKAYRAKELNASNEVVLSSIDEAPASTGLILKGTAGASYRIPLLNIADNVGTNLLVGTNTVTEVAASTDGAYNYMWANGSNGIGFYKVESATTSAAGKAYLSTTTALTQSFGARSFIFEDEEGGTTGISEAKLLNNNEEIINNNFFDLQGRRVAQPTKGLYIVNGKKVIVK